MGGFQKGLQGRADGDFKGFRGLIQEEGSRRAEIAAERKASGLEGTMELFRLE